MTLEIQPCRTLRGEIFLPPDKSTLHRALYLALLARSSSHLTPRSTARDVQATLAAIQHLGARVEEDGKGWTIHPPHQPTASDAVLHAQNSGSTLRMGLGAVANFPVRTLWDGDQSLRKRPMGRVLIPLQQRGVRVCSAEGQWPLCVEGPGRRALHYRSPVASAQVKTAVLFSGLYAEGETLYTEPFLSRSHTENLLRFLDIPLECKGNTLHLTPHPVPGFRLTVHGDPSAAAPFVVLTLLHPDAEVVIHDVNLNPVRRAYLDLLREAGGNIRIEEHPDPDNPEPHGTLVVQSSTLERLNVSPDLVPALVDELPFLALAATFAKRPSRIDGLAELRVKESNRYQGVCTFLQKMGAQIRCRNDGWEISPSRLRGGVVLDSRMDHRMLFLGAVAGMLVEGGIRLHETHWARVSHPGFFPALEALCAG